MDKAHLTCGADSPGKGAAPPPRRHSLQLTGACGGTKTSVDPALPPVSSIWEKRGEDSTPGDFPSGHIVKKCSYELVKNKNKKCAYELVKNNVLRLSPYLNSFEVSRNGDVS